MRDKVKCCNCHWVGTVRTGEEYCPNCKTKGHLAWVDTNNQEVEDKGGVNE